MDDNSHIIRLIKGFAVAAVLFIALGPPMFTYYLGYERVKGAAEVDISIRMRLATQLISANPDHWQYEDIRLVDLLGQNEVSNDTNLYQIHDATGKLIAQSPAKPLHSGWPTLVRSQQLHDYGQQVGLITLKYSLRNVIVNTITAAIFAFLVSVVFYIALRQLPLTVLNRTWKQMAYLASHDALTELPNRASLQTQANDIFPLAHPGAQAAVFCLDLDRFKAINDTLGHSIGDALLKAVAGRLRDCVRTDGIVARLGGDEFAVIFVSDNLPDGATILAERICEAMSMPFEFDGHQILSGVSIGISLAPNDGEFVDLLLKNADTALYRAKNDGRGVYRFYEPKMDAQMQARRALEFDLKKAIEQEEFELHYQPLVNLESNNITGVEALLRWNHPEHGLVSPIDFISVAEESGLIVPLGEWVIRTACQQVADWPSNIKVAVNISSVQFSNDNLLPTIFSALASSGISPGQLELEITESVMLEDESSTLVKLRDLKNMGVRIAVDDFGTGYSSLSYLRKFPFDKIKLDGSFVDSLTEKNGDCPIVSAVANIASSFGFSTTAEHVETDVQRELVKKAGYTEMQGYLFSPPRPADEITQIFFKPVGITSLSA